MGPYIISGAALAFAGCEALIVTGWRLAAGVADRDPATVDLEDA